MEEQNIGYTGLTQATSDLDCNDGDLSISHNIVNQNGAMRPVWVPQAGMTLHSGEKLLHIHVNADYKNYIIEKSDWKLYFFTEEDVTRNSFYSTGGDKVREVVSFGNTLVVAFEGSIQYFLFENGDYTELGDGLTDMGLIFALGGQEETTDERDVDLSGNTTASPPGNGAFSLAAGTQLDDSVRADINIAIEEAKQNGMFTDPFLVRYAYKTVNGYTYHSAPVLMVPNGGCFPYMTAEAFDLSGVGNFKFEVYSEIHDESAPSLIEISTMKLEPDGNHIRVKGNGSFEYNKYYYTSGQEWVEVEAARVRITRIYGLSCKMNTCRLAFKLKNESALQALKKWGDLITSVDIFITPPITRLLSSGPWTYYIPAPFVEPTHKSKGGFMQIDEGIFGYSGDFTKDTDYIIRAPQRTNEEYEELVATSADFRKVKSFTLPDLEEQLAKSTDGFIGVNIDPEVLTNIGVQETLDITDDYMSRDTFTGGSVYVYNSRLHVANIRRKPYSFSPDLLFCYTNGYLNSNGEAVQKTYDYKIISYIEGDETGLTIRTDSDTAQLYGLPRWAYFPNPNTERAVIERDNNGTLAYAELDLKESAYLNGAYYLGGYSTFGRYFESGYIDFSSTVPSMPPGTEYIYEGNKLYVSEVNNPLLFTLDGRVNVGTGTLLRVASLTKALSEGQFGQYPLIAFSTDGIWALEVDTSTGLYSSVAPMAREVCNNAESVTQIDGGIIFTTDKGVMVVDGSSVTPLSAELNGPPFRVETVDRLQTVISKEELSDELAETTDANSFFRGCRVAYDYANRRLLFIDPNKTYAYIYAIDSHSWATMTSGFSSVVTDYPDCYLQRGLELINISQQPDYADERETKVFLLSRPLKLGDDGLKTMNTVINRGTMRRSDGGLVVFASHDGLRYVPIGSATGSRVSRLQGTPYRYFRLLVVRKMQMRESLSMSSAYFTRKWRNKPR